MRCSGWRHGLCETVRQYLVIRRQGGMKRRMQQLVWLLGVCGSLMLLWGVWTSSTVMAQAPKAEFKLKLMGINRTLDPWKLYEEWARSVEQRTKAGCNLS